MIRLTNQRWQRCLSDLQPAEEFPHSFQLEPGDIFSLDESLKRLERQERNAIEAGQYILPFQQARVHNFLAYIHCCLGEFPDALDLCDHVLRVDGQNSNLISLANKVIILRHMARRKEADEVLAELRRVHTQPDFGHLKVLALGELAECYSRMGRHVKLKAIELFKEIIPRGRYPEILDWRYGIALMYRQSLSLQHIPYTVFNPTTFENLLHKAVRHLYMVAEKWWKRPVEEDACHDNWLAHDNYQRVMRGKAFSEIALLIFSTIDPRLKRWITSSTKLTLAKACDLACWYGSDNSSVLRKVGRIYRSGALIVDLLPQALDLLDKAASLQSSSSIFHDRGLAYLSMAKRVKKLMQRMEFIKSRRIKHPGINSLRSKKKWKWAHKRWFPMAQRYTPVPFDWAHNSEKYIVQIIKKIIKSPDPREIMGLRPGDQYVLEAVDNLRKACSESEGQNTRALYDLALAYFAVDDEEEAFKWLEEICSRYTTQIDLRTTSINVLDVIAAYEQRGLWRLKQSREEKWNTTRKRELRRQGINFLETALQLSARHFTRHTAIGQYSKSSWLSVGILFQQVNKSNLPEEEKLRVQIGLMQLVNHSTKLKELFGLLEQIILKRKESNPKAVFVCMERCIRRNKRGKAVVLLDILLRCVKRENRMEYLKNGTVHNVYIGSAIQCLRRGNSEGAVHLIRSVFDDIHGNAIPDSASWTTFVDHEDISDETESDDDEHAQKTEVFKKMSKNGKKKQEEDDNNAETERVRQRKEKSWHVMVIHNNTDEAEKTAEKLTRVLKLCGVSVTFMSDHCRPGILEMPGVLENMDAAWSTVVVVGTPPINEYPDKDKDNREFDAYCCRAAQQRSTYVFKLEEDVTVPKVLTDFPTMTLPSTVLDIPDWVLVTRPAGADGQAVEMAQLNFEGPEGGQAAQESKTEAEGGQGPPTELEDPRVKRAVKALGRVLKFITTHPEET